MSQSKALARQKQAESQSQGRSDVLRKLCVERVDLGFGAFYGFNFIDIFLWESSAAISSGCFQARAHLSERRLSLSVPSSKNR